MKSTRRGSFPVHRSEKTPGSKYSSTSGLSPRGAWKIPWTEEPSGLQSMGSQSRTRLSDFSSLHFSKVKGSVVSSSLQPQGLSPAKLLCPWDSPGKGTGVGCHFLLQGTFLTQESNLGLSHCRQTLYHLSHQGNINNNLNEFKKIYFESIMPQTSHKRSNFYEGIK